MKTLLSALVFASILTLAPGCATMTKSECAAADWQAIGYAEGAKGSDQQYFERVRKDCAKHKIRADSDAFKAGHREGIQDYCIFDNGLALGKSGGAYNHQCS